MNKNFPPPNTRATSPGPEAGPGGSRRVGIVALTVACCVGCSIAAVFVTHRLLREPPPAPNAGAAAEMERLIQRIDARDERLAAADEPAKGASEPLSEPARSQSQAAASPSPEAQASAPGPTPCDNCESAFVSEWRSRFAEMSAKNLEDQVRRAGLIAPPPVPGWAGIQLTCTESQQKCVSYLWSQRVLPFWEAEKMARANKDYFDTKVKPNLPKKP